MAPYNVSTVSSVASRSGRLARRLIVKHVLSPNVLLAFIPMTFIAAFLQWSDVYVSALSFLAIIPLSAIVSDASDTVGNRWGAVIGGLVNATFGNTVELIVSISTCVHLYKLTKQNRLEYWQLATVSSVLPNLL